MGIPVENFFRYSVIDQKPKSDEKPRKTVGLTCALNFYDACHKVIDAFGEECVLEMEIKFVREGDVMEVDEVIDILKDIGKEV